MSTPAADKPATNTLAALAERLKRPARRQADPDALEKTQKVYEGTYNIWYNKWTGQKHKGRFEYGERAPTRVNVAKDTGYTLADKRKAQNPATRTYICLMFARGCCHKGHRCEYMHRVPVVEDTVEVMKDCFGRDRHRDEREDMNGVGCFNRENRSLYIGGLHPYERGDAERVIRKHFAVFGPIERINVIHDRAIAFVMYERRHTAEFAKEAMEHQALDAGEIINVRWANDDPNPVAQQRQRKRVQDQFIEGYVAKKAKTGGAAYMDDEARKLIEANPIYQQYYTYGAATEEEAEIKAEEPPKEDGTPAALPPPDAAETPEDGNAAYAAQPPQDGTEYPEEYVQAYYAQLYAQYGYGAAPEDQDQQQDSAPPSDGAGTGPTAPPAARPLIAYGSDDDDDED